VGTLAGVAVYLACAPLPLAAYVLATAGLFVLGIWACGSAARSLGVHDHPAIVWDEVVGLLVTMVGTPPSWTVIAAGFLLFRALDIFKPWPIYILDRHLRGGLGIMADDLLAGILAAFVLHLLRLWPGLT
jgi:phosphatidylglycerophosphatase A